MARYICAVIKAHHKLDDQIGAIVRVDIYRQSLTRFLLCRGSLQKKTRLTVARVKP